MRVNRQTGLTLIELIVAVAIGALVLTAISALYRNFSASWRETELRTDAQSSVADLIAAIERDFNRRNGYSLSWPIGSAGVNQYLVVGQVEPSDGGPVHREYRYFTECVASTRPPPPSSAGTCEHGCPVGQAPRVVFEVTDLMGTVLSSRTIPSPGSKLTGAALCASEGTDFVKIGVVAFLQIGDADKAELSVRYLPAQQFTLNSMKTVR